MPTNDGYVGPLEIPVPQNGQYTSFTDPTIQGLLEYFAHWIRYGLGGKYTDVNNNIADAMPEDNLFPFDPTENWVRKSTPAVYLWWVGESQRIEYSIAKKVRKRRFRLFYVATEVVMPGGGKAYSGMPGAVDAILHKASAHGYHSTFGYNGDPVGTPISQSLDLVGWQYDGGKQDFSQRIPNVAANPGGAGGGHATRGYPVLFGNVTVWEEIEAPTLSDSDSALDISLSINVNDPSDDRGPLTILDRYLISPSEADDNGE